MNRFFLGFLCQMISFGLFSNDADSVLRLMARENSPQFYRSLRLQIQKMEHGEAISLLTEQIRTQEAEDKQGNAINLKIILGLVLGSTSSPDGFMMIQEALFKAQKYRLSYEEAEAYLQLEKILKGNGEKEGALKQFLPAAKICKDRQYKELGFQVYFEISNLQYVANNYEEALVAMNEGVSSYTIGDWLLAEDYIKYDIMRAFNTIALCHMLLNQYEAALKQYKNALIVAENRQDEFWNGLIRGNMGNVLVRQNKLELAEQLLNIDLSTSKKFRSFSSIASTYVSLGQLYLKREDLQTSEKYYDSAESVIISKKLSLPGYYQRRADFEYAKGDYKSAVDLKNLYEAITDSLNKIRKSKELLMLNVNFEFQSKLDSLKLLEKESLLKDQALKNKNLLIYGGSFTILLSLALLVALLKSNMLKVKLNKELELEVVKRTRKLAITIKELDTFIYRLSHDFRRPLTTLIGLDNLGRTITRDPEVQELFSKVGITARQMDRMLLKMRFIHEINTVVPSMTDVPLKEVVEQVVQGFDDEFLKSSVRIYIDIHPEMIVKTDERFLHPILTNLLENAFVFADAAKETMYVKITSRANEDRWVLEVRDNGVGVSAEVKDRIYEPFFRGSQISQGNGLGLYLVKKAAGKLKGKIEDHIGDQGESIFKLEFFTA